MKHFLPKNVALQFRARLDIQDANFVIKNYSGIKNSVMS